MKFIASTRAIGQAGALALLLTLGALGVTSRAMAQAAADGARAAPLELVVLGSGGPGAAGRAGSSYAVLVDGVARVLVDAGPGAFARLGEAALPLQKVDVVLLTHLHIDHAGELPGLVKARALAGTGAVRLKVIGPVGRARSGQTPGFPSTSRFVDMLFGRQGAFAYLDGFNVPVSFDVTNIGPPAIGLPTPIRVYSAGGLHISAIPGHHRDAPSVIYRIEYGDKSIAFSGDIDADGLLNLNAIARDASVLVFNTVVLDAPASPAGLYALHTPPKAIGEVAARARVQHLVLSHLSPAVEARRADVEASIRQAYGAPLSFAEDGQRIAP